MCGIFSVHGAKDPALLASMRDRLGHRGPDGHGEFLADDVSLGHVRLAIIDVAQLVTGKDFYSGGRSVESLQLDGMAVKELRELAINGLYGAE